MSTKSVESVIQNVIVCFNKEAEQDIIGFDKTFVLSGQEADLDSVHFLDFISQVEDQVGQTFEKEISLLDDYSLDSNHSNPLRTVGSLQKHVEQLVSV